MYYTMIYIFNNNKHISDIANENEVRSCQMQTLYVSFKDLDWQVQFFIYLFLKIKYKC